MQRWKAIAFATLMGSALVSSAGAAEIDVGKPDRAREIVAGMIPAACKGINPSGSAPAGDDRFGSTLAYGKQDGNKRLIAYEIHLALDEACVHATTARLKREVRHGLRIFPDRRIVRFALYADGPTDLKAIVIFSVRVKSNAEWDALESK